MTRIAKIFYMTFVGMLLAAAPAAAQQLEPAPPEPPPAGGWWFCPASRTYFPQAATCPLPWRLVTGAEADQLRREKAQQDEAQRQADRAAAAAKEKRAAEERARRAAQQRADSAAAAAKVKAEEDAVTKAQEERETVRLAALAQQEKDDAAAGYRRLDIDDLLLDYRDLGDGDKVVITGLYHRFASIESIDAGPWSTSPVYLDMDGLSHGIHKQLLSCAEKTPLQCVVTVWAHKGCIMNAFGHATEAPCLIVDGVRGGRYDRPLPAGIWTVYH